MHIKSLHNYVERYINITQLKTRVYSILRLSQGEMEKQTQIEKSNIQKTTGKDFKRNF